MSESVKATPVVRGASGGGRREGECGKDGSQVNAEAPYSLSLSFSVRLCLERALVSRWMMIRG